MMLTVITMMMLDRMLSLHLCTCRLKTLWYTFASFHNSVEIEVRTCVYFISAFSVTFFVCKYISVLASFFV